MSVNKVFARLTSDWQDKFNRLLPGYLFWPFLTNWDCISHRKVIRKTITLLRSFFLISQITRLSLFDLNLDIKSIETIFYLQTFCFINFFFELHFLLQLNALRYRSTTFRMLSWIFCAKIGPTYIKILLTWTKCLVSAKCWISAICSLFPVIKQ